MFVCPPVDISGASLATSANEEGPWEKDTIMLVGRKPWEEEIKQ